MVLSKVWRIYKADPASKAVRCGSENFETPCAQSAGLIESLGRACLDCPSGLSRHLMSKRAELLILPGHDLEMLAHLLGRQDEKLGWGLRTQQLLDVVEGGASIGTDNVDKLVIIVCRSLGSGRVAALVVCVMTL
jgi:hypothetical protein